jgi:hypothetical protein
MLSFIKNWPDLAASVYLSEAPSPPRFLFGVQKQFCRFRIGSNTQCVTLVDALHTIWSPPRYSLYKYIDVQGADDKLGQTLRTRLKQQNK